MPRHLMDLLLLDFVRPGCDVATRPEWTRQVARDRCFYERLFPGTLDLAEVSPSSVAHA